MISTICYMDDDGNQCQLIEEDDYSFTLYRHHKDGHMTVERQPPPTCGQLTYSGMLKAPLPKYDPSLHDPQMPLSFGDNWDESDWPTPNPPPSNPYVATNLLKCKCWVCQQEFSPIQRYDYSTGKTHISMTHCGRNASIFLTAAEIEANNNTGFYQAFLFIY